MTGLFLAKLLPLFVYPLGAAMLVSILAFALSFTNRRRIGQGLLGLALLILWIAATPICANWLNWQLESELAPVSVDALPQSDAMILLGGIGPADRIVETLRIYRAGKAPLIVISGGNQPWRAHAVPEAELISDVLVGLGMPISALILETESRNTRENAVNTAAIFKAHGWRTGLLVTSGAHMPRALAAFQKMGISLVPAVTNIYAGPPQFATLLDLLPDANALAHTTSAIKEMIGHGVYRFRGWA
jgi:uncharacterized SAM-binding protein YcdF (DUF218 family)